jgi:hypothetical protein
VIDGATSFEKDPRHIIVFPVTLIGWDFGPTPPGLDPTTAYQLGAYETGYHDVTSEGCYFVTQPLPQPRCSCGRFHP